MAGVGGGTAGGGLHASGQGVNTTSALVALTVLLFMIGLITSLNDILIPHLKAIFNLSYTQAALIQFCFFGAYFVMSVPSGYIVKRLGYKHSIVLALGVAALGCLLFYPAAEYRVYALFLGALFTLGSAFALLQVTVNPYIAVLGPAETSSSRLTTSQAFNSLGTTIGPLFGGFLIFSGVSVAAGVALSSEQIQNEVNLVQPPYLGLALVLALIALAVTKLRLPHLHEGASDDVGDGRDPALLEGVHSAWQLKHLVLGVVGIFAYVGAEVAIGSYLINLMMEADVAGLTEQAAAQKLALYWGGAMVGRFVGIFLLRAIRPGLLLSINAVVILSLLIAAMLIKGPIAMWAVLAIGLFNSIMFPTIFTLAIKGIGPYTEQGSGLLCTAIVGGALIPLVQGAAADGIGLLYSFIVPALCYVYIAYYGVFGSKPARF
jgi:FHS family L-fucose permease-like MFS transporter